jgi:hypothetical protein
LAVGEGGPRKRNDHGYDDYYDHHDDDLGHFAGF